MEKRWAVWVNVGETSDYGYVSASWKLGSGRRIATAWKSEAVSFACLDDAENFISDHGWEFDTGVRAGVTTAYVVEV